MTETVTAVTPEEPPKASRAGRNLSAAIIVGVGLLLILAVSLAFRPEPFVVLVAVIIGGGMWELRAALENAGLEIAIWPLLAGTVAMIIAAFLGGIEALLVIFVLTLLAVTVWQVALAILERTPISAVNVLASIFSAAYLPLMASFVVLLLNQPNGNWRVALLVLLSVANDTGGYIAGVLFGKHPMAPSVSPKKSWEGFAGSIILTCAVAIIGSWLVLDLPFAAGSVAVGTNLHWFDMFWHNIFGSALWLGLILGVVATITSTLGDLSESLIKRDLGIKDMGNILPGHGGIMDRIDSIIFSAPFVYVIMLLSLQYSFPV
ncbi:MAG: phosphatidate cytidylyltransferase [Promicromonosporaceae bacterium]|nr:phosphatidate cytidylyltransferase [Promicromonosporaceae bacterium]